MRKGEFEYTYKDKNGDWMEPTTDYPGTALPEYVATSPNTFQKNIKGSISYCCGPTELSIHWDRKVMTLEPNSSYEILQRNAKRHKLILAEGVITVNDTEYSGPTILTIKPFDTVVAKTLVYCAEVWVEN